jgi:hypothetical protein
MQVFDVVKQVTISTDGIELLDIAIAHRSLHVSGLLLLKLQHCGRRYTSLNSVRRTCRLNPWIDLFIRCEKNVQQLSS